MAEVEEVQLECARVGPVVGDPCDGDAGARGGHLEDASALARAEIADVAVMREQLGPAREVAHAGEDAFARGGNVDGGDAAHSEG